MPTTLPVKYYGIEVVYHTDLYLDEQLDKVFFDERSDDSSDNALLCTLHVDDELIDKVRTSQLWLSSVPIKWGNENDGVITLEIKQGDVKFDEYVLKQMEAVGLTPDKFKYAFEVSANKQVLFCIKSDFLMPGSTLVFDTFDINQFTK